jgi:hypothetical protein
VPYATAVADTTVACTITGVEPIGDLNVLGGDNVTFTGTNFPHQIAENTVAIVLTTATKTSNCVVLATESTKMACQTDPFPDKTAAAATAVSIGVTINGAAVAVSQAGAIRGPPKTGSGLTPAYASPVLKTQLTIQLSADFPHTLARADFTVNATSTTKSSYVRYMNVIAVDDTAKTLKCMFGGADTGGTKEANFQISIRHKTYGLLDTTGMILKVGAKVTSFTPTTGSIYGGTLLTITGENFAPKDIQDNPVQISYNGALGSTDCFLISTSTTEIKCRVDTKNMERKDAETAEMIVFLKTSEEAKCVSPACKYTYTSSLPKVTSATAKWDETSKKWQLEVVGTSFVGTTANIEYYVDDVKQKVLSATATKVVFELQDLKDVKPTKFMLYFPVGVPAGHALITAGFTLEPKLAKLVPNAGGIGGALVTATVGGVGTATTGLSLVDSKGASICETIKVTAFATVQCTTFAKEMAASAISVKLGGADAAACVGETAECAYQ